MQKQKASKILAIIWVIYFIPVLTVGVIWAVNELFGVNTKKVITWLAQCSLPYLTLILSSYFSSKKMKNLSQEITVDKFFLAVILSLTYFAFTIIIMYSVAKENFLGKDPMQPLESLNIYLTFFQATFIYLLGYFFIFHDKKN